MKAFDKLGELGFTFFLGADIPMLLLGLCCSGIADGNCYIYCALKFILAIAFSYVITRCCEKPLLAWGKGVEKSL